MKCWNCGFENPPNVKFCNNCGSPQQRPCPRCGTTNPPGSKFCNNCGLNLQEAYVAPASSPASPGAASAPSTAQDLIARYMPQDLADKIKEASSRGGVEGERRIATILFCDVKGSTAMAETLDPEEWADIMNRAFRYLIEPVYRYEGTVARLMGDAILAFFGAPIAHEDDPYRAVLASLDILHGIDDYRDRVRRDNGLDFSVRIGLNTGLVVVGNVGSDLKYEYTAMGDAINLASRLQAAAEPDSVLISENTYHQVAQLVDVIDKGKVQIKGKAEPVRVYQVTAARQGVARTRGLAGLTSPMVDRRREFAALMQTLDDLRAGRGSIVSVIGEAGLGKSRLIAEWHKAVDLHGGDWPIRWVEGRCLSYGASMAHHLSMDILRNLIGAPAGATEEETRSALRASLDRGMETDTDDAYAYLAHLLGLSLDEKASAQVRYLDGAALQAKYISAVRSLLQSIARQTPTVIVSEDVQWADPSSVELGLQVLPLASEIPIVFAFVTRADKETPGWKLVTQAHEVPGAGAIDLYLAPLSESDSKQLVSNLLELEELPESARDLILTKAEGNPFFVEEVIRMLIDRGVLHREEGRWALSGDIKSIDIPDTLQGVLTARIDRLPEEARRVLQVASVIGRKFPIKVLAAVLETEGLS